jgi:colicin import membrane protein
METSQDKWVSLLLAIGMHLALFGLLFVGALWHTQPEVLSIRGEPIEAMLMSAPPSGAKPSPKPAPKPVERPAQPKPEERETAPAPQPKPSPSPQTANESPQPKPQTPVPQPDTVDRERAARAAIAEREKAEQEQKERRRQEQILLDEQKKQEEAERMQRLRKQEEERQKQLDDIRRQREEAEKKRKREQEALQQLADRRANQNPPAQRVDNRETRPVQEIGNRGVDESLLGRYKVAIQQLVMANWSRPETAQAGIRCSLKIVQIIGGEVIQASVISPCNADPLTRRSIEAAVLKAQPLPYQGFETVFQREIIFNFTYDGN